MGLATPLIDGMVVSRRILGALIRQTSLNMARRKRLENERFLHAFNTILEIGLLISKDIYKSSCSIPISAYFSYQPPHVRRKLKVQEIMSKFPCTFTPPEFYSYFFEAPFSSESEKESSPQSSPKKAET